MTEVKPEPTRQWPDNIVAGKIYYGRADNYDGFYLADCDHGIPTIGAVTHTNPPTIRGQNVGVFNYPGQTEAIAKQLCDRWNSHDALVEALAEVMVWIDNWSPAFVEDDEWLDTKEKVRAALAKAVQP